MCSGFPQNPLRPTNRRAARSQSVIEHFTILPSSQQTPPSRLARFGRRETRNPRISLLRAAHGGFARIPSGAACASREREATRPHAPRGAYGSTPSLRSSMICNQRQSASPPPIRAFRVVWRLDTLPVLMKNVGYALQSHSLCPKHIQPSSHAVPCTALLRRISSHELGNALKTAPVEPAGTPA